MKVKFVRDFDYKKSEMVIGESITGGIEIIILDSYNNDAGVTSTRRRSDFIVTRDQAFDIVDLIHKVYGTSKNG